jgi:hypothetical protein
MAKLNPYVMAKVGVSKMGPISFQAVSFKLRSVLLITLWTSKLPKLKLYSLRVLF